MAGDRAVAFLVVKFDGEYDGEYDGEFDGEVTSRRLKTIAAVWGM